MADSHSVSMSWCSAHFVDVWPDIVHLHPVAHRCFTFTLFVPSLCGLSMFKTLDSVSDTFHIIKSL
jgi:hypothetical protein